MSIKTSLQSIVKNLQKSTSGSTFGAPVTNRLSLLLATSNYQLATPLHLSTHLGAQRRGFTLIETMVAISVLVVAVSAPLTLASQSLFAALYAKDQTTAFYLAQEAVEMVRNKRDSNMLRSLHGQEVEWLNGIPIGSSFHVDIPNDTIAECLTDCLATKLRNDGTFYNHESGETSRFSRSVLVTENPDLVGEAVISVVVEWQTGAFRKRSITLETRIYDWAPRGSDQRGSLDTPTDTMLASLSVDLLHMSRN